MEEKQLSWCLIIEHLFEVIWQSYQETGDVPENVRNALEEISKVDIVVDMVADLKSTQEPIVRLQKQVRSFECLVHLVGSDDHWILDGDNRLTILFDSFYRLAFLDGLESVTPRVRKVMDEFLVQLVLGAWCSQGPVYAASAYQQMVQIVGLHDGEAKNVLRDAFGSDMKTDEEIDNSERTLKKIMHSRPWSSFKSGFLGWLEDSFCIEQLVGKESAISAWARTSSENMKARQAAILSIEASCQSVDVAKELEGNHPDNSSGINAPLQSNEESKVRNIKPSHHHGKPYCQIQPIIALSQIRLMTPLTLQEPFLRLMKPFTTGSGTLTSGNTLYLA